MATSGQDPGHEPTPPQPLPLQVSVVNFAKLFGTLLASILTAVATLAGISQLTGYSAYTGDELASHYGERVRQEIEDAQPEVPSETNEPEPSTYKECLSNPDFTFGDCRDKFPNR